jgi:hypothetical protein
MNRAYHVPWMRWLTSGFGDRVSAIESAHARALLDRELGLLWGLTRRSHAKDASRPVSGATRCHR